MNQRYANSPDEVAGMNTAQLRNNFLITDIMQAGKFSFEYSHFDRAIIGSVVPLATAMPLENFPELRSEYFLERREMGAINIGGPGSILVDGQSMDVAKLDAVYIGKGSREVVFRSTSSDNPAMFYLFSTPAHAVLPSGLITREEANPATIGSSETANERTIYKYIFMEGRQSCQLVMGLTILKPGSVWNTMPAHTHDRRMEAYFYFDLNPEQSVFHFMGKPNETRHLLVRNNQAVISPPWSIHSGCGTSNYGFIWAMGGENKDYADMDPAPVLL